MSTARPNYDPHYLPSPQEIRDACATIQREWTPQQRELRARGLEGKAKVIRFNRWSVPTVRKVVFQ